MNHAVFGTLNFGSHSGVATGNFSASYLQSTTLNLACTPGTAVSMSIDGGANYTSVRNLKHTSSSNTVAYPLYRHHKRGGELLSTGARAVRLSLSLWRAAGLIAAFACLPADALPVANFQVAASIVAGCVVSGSNTVALPHSGLG
ncbi:hypothetical protein CRX72_04750 [Pantoea sp. BRM17]|nr:hypothetical protein CRX72_04750 [Pantoea sp. BRM17]